MFNSRRLSHLLDHGNRVSGREVRNASNVHMIIAGMSQVATPQVVSMEIAPNYQPHPTNVDVQEAITAQLVDMYLNDVA